MNKLTLDTMPSFFINMIALFIKFMLKTPKVKTSITIFGVDKNW